MKIGHQAYELSLFKKDGIWVFNDAEMGLVEEPLILGMTQIIDFLVGPGMNRAVMRFTDGVDLMQYTLIRGEPFEGGYVYQLKGTGMTGWLCPATLHYFPEGHPYAISLMIAGVRGGA